VLAKAEALIREGKAAEAYALLQPLEENRAGDPDFDYLLGLAALESGQPGQATMALERVLLVDPSYAAARVDLGRAYFALGDRERAQAELTTALAQEPPAAARAVIEQYLTEIQTQTEQPGTRFSGYMDVGTGWNSNVNAGPSETEIFIPFFGRTARLAQRSQEQDDGFLGVAFGGELSRTLSGPLAAVAGANLRFRRYPSESDFNYSIFGVHAGLSRTQGAHYGRIAAYGEHYILGNETNHDSFGLFGEWKYAYSAQTLLQLYSQVGRILYTKIDKVNDVDHGLLGVGIGRAFGSKVIAGLDVYTDYETERRRRPDGDRWLIGARVNGQYAVNRTTVVYANAGAQFSDYRRENLLFRTTRDDDLYDIATGVSFELNPRWTLQPQLAYIRNDSNIAINEYDSVEVSLTLRRRFP
jgi:tetratricopeptide (TPR) repeat protein